ncbi:hypothetical protein AB2L57_15995 [Microbacterium sp. HA-8]|uniref:hypothetical protein n=1 Tax=Microbacterium sp. HA-8 TaxID=3234200 RepID=UPI0038F6CB0D
MTDAPARPHTRPRVDLIRGLVAVAALPSALTSPVAVAAVLEGGISLGTVVSGAVLSPLVLPGVLGGVFSGFRVFSVFGAAQGHDRGDAAAERSEVDAEVRVRSFGGDLLWGAVIAAVTGILGALLAGVATGSAAPAALVVIAVLPVAWGIGWCVGAVTGATLAAATAIAWGAVRSRRRGRGA